MTNSKKMVMVGVLVACLGLIASPAQARLEPTAWQRMFFGLDLGLSASLNKAKNNGPRQKIGGLVGLVGGYMLYQPLGLSLVGHSDFTFRKSQTTNTNHIFFAYEGTLGVEFMLRGWRAPLYISPETQIGFFVAKESGIATQAGFVWKMGVSVAYILAQRFELRFTPFRLALDVPFTSNYKSSYSAALFYELLFSFRYRY